MYWNYAWWCGGPSAWELEYIPATLRVERDRFVPRQAMVSIDALALDELKPDQLYIALHAIRSEGRYALACSTGRDGLTREEAKVYEYCRDRCPACQSTMPSQQKWCFKQPLSIVAHHVRLDEETTQDALIRLTDLGFITCLPNPYHAEEAFELLIIAHGRTVRRVPPEPPEPPSLPEVTSGHSEIPLVYFIQAGKSGRIKIGSSVNPEQRLANMKTASPEPLRLIGTIESDEGKIHQLFSEYRAHGEWFEPVPELLAFIEENI